MVQPKTMAFPQFMTHLPAINMTSSQFLGESDGERQIEGPQLIPSTSPFGNGMEWTKKSQETGWNIQKGLDFREPSNIIKYHQILWINPWNYGSTVDHLQFLQFSTAINWYQLSKKNHGILDPPWSSPSAWRTPKQWPPAKEMGQGEAQALSSWGYPKRWYWYSWFISWKIWENPIKVDDLLLNMAI